jgi:thiol:disulfide interchange protein DsbD
MESILLFVSFFAAGLALNLTPCVYPMISVTVSLFRPKHHETISHSFAKALAYVLGIVLMYSALGLFVALTGSLFGGILQNKWVLLVIGALMFALALSMFGAYQIQVPAWLLNRTRRREISYWGLFVSGIFVGVFAAPCIGPPIIALLTLVGERGDPVFGFFAFFVLSLGLGLPYLVLGTFSGLINKLPRSGDWLIWIERSFGVVLLGLSFFYFSLAFKPEWIKWVLPVTLIAGGFYLGFLEGRGGKHKIWFLRLKGALGIIAVLIGFAIVFSPPREKLVWEPYEPQRLAAAMTENKPIVIDFYADWCIACHELEQFVFSHPGVAQYLLEFTRIRVDATDFEDPQAAEIMERYGVFGLPTVVFLNADGREAEDARVIGYVSPAEFLKSLKSVHPKPEG